MNLKLKIKNLKLPQGFTLIELLIVLAILSVLVAVLMTLINPITQFQKANDARRKSDLAQIQKTLEAYYDDNGKYPDSSAGYKISPPSGVLNWGDTWVAYKTTLPADPSSSRNYTYYSTGQVYRLYASLERGGKDPQACYSSGAVCANAGAANCGGTCNYGVSSPNTSP